MTRRTLPPLLATLLALGAASPLARPLAAQEHVHHPGMTHPAPRDTAATPTQPGQAAFAAIAEVVAILERDPRTDWSRVSVERLRRHLIDMDEVTLRADVTESAVPGGARFVVRGSGRTLAAIRRMTHAHAAMLGAELGYRATVVDRAGGVTMTVLARDAADARTVAKVRGLGFVGLMASGMHHGAHHLALARGEAPHGHAHAH